MRITRFLYPTTWLIGQFICLQAASAQHHSDDVLEVRAQGFTPSISTSYVRSAADEDSAYYRSIAAAEINVSYAVPNDKGILGLTTGLARDLEALEERNVWSSTNLVYTGHPIEIAQDLAFTYAGLVTAPTNSDMRDYLSYRGSTGLRSSLTRTWTALPIGRKLKTSVTGSAIRNFFQYDASQAGIPNTILALGASVSAALEINEMFQASGSFGLKKPQKSNGTWKDANYVHKIAAGVNLTKDMSVTLSETTENRAYTYDAQTTQFALYDFEATMYELAATYKF
ncbi:MAG TPA: hypothetical protein VE954_17895 [Oligoflexus sp.]|uniref:hypothetical protein n=1 Tax=Oligoflexus sp. TaxID=1971216 RepID=UPI002D2DDFD6|nr:hypothetical protein [Oligoflexus sp.]HYX34972.1 hypothetical protein [Oligoflexus sp.]